MDRRSRGRAVAGGLRHAALALSTFALALLVWLAAIALLPVTFGWAPYVVTTGSMAPRIPAGTVLVASPPPAAAVAPGAVVVFTDASGRTLTHRVVETGAAGRYRTRGDANAVPDAAPVDHDQVLGVGRVVVPLLGLPVAWAVGGHWAPAALAVAGVAAACWPALGALQRRRRAARARPSGNARERAPVQRRRRGVPAAAGALATVALAGTAVALAGASFVGAATQPSNRWTAATTFGGFVSVTASDLPAGAGDAAQEFTFTLGSPLPDGAAVTVDLTEAYRGPVDYREAAQPTTSLGQASLETRRGNSPNREALISWEPPAGGLGGGVEVAITIPSGVTTTTATAEDLPAVAVRTDSGATRTALFSVR